MYDFKQKVAIVTGGASGIGTALCSELAKNGGTVIVADIDIRSAQKVADQIKEQGGLAYARQLDVTREEVFHQLVNQTVADHGQLDYLFNNAGISVTGDARDLRIEHWRSVIDVNLWGVIHGTMAAYPIMAKQGAGHIVNTASLAGLLPYPTNLPYATTKHAVVGFSISLRAEAADLGVKIGVVCPGYIHSGIYQVATIVNVPREKILAAIPFKLMDTKLAARRILRGVSRNTAIIVFPRYARLLWWMYRVNSSLMNPLAVKMIRDLRRDRTPDI